MPSDPPAADPRPATVRLVGAGPGDARLLTRWGEACLKLADVVLADALIDPSVLQLVRKGTEVVVRSHSPSDVVGTRERNQRELIDRMIAEARAGRSVVRLKGGDPSVFGRGHEEADALLAAGVPVEIVPGVTAASAAAALAGVPLTHRDHAGAVCFVTGHEAGRRGGGIDLAAIAAFPGTRVFYMARRRVAAIAGRLLDAGLSPETPAAVVAEAARATQRTVCGTVATVAEDADAAGLPGPAVLFVGETAAAPGPRAWWDRRPLARLTVAAVGADDSNPPLFRLRELGAEPVPLSLLHTETLAPADDLAADITAADWLAFTSRNGVLDGLRSVRDGRALGGKMVAAVGPSTAEVLRGRWIRPDIVPDTHDAEHLAAALAPHVRGKRVLWPTCPEAKSTLEDRLTEAGAEVRRVHVYEQRPATELPAGFRAKLDDGAVDWALVSSGNVARTFADLTAGSPGLGRLKVAAMSENVAAVCRELGLTVAAVAETHSWDGLVDALLGAVAADRDGRSG